jgi:hypothetical protein
MDWLIPEVRVSCMKNFSFYLAVNTLHLDCKGQSVKLFWKLSAVLFVESSAECRVLQAARCHLTQDAVCFSTANIRALLEMSFKNQ